MKWTTWVPLWFGASVAIGLFLGAVGKTLDRFESWRQRRADARFAEELRRRRSDRVRCGGRS